MSLRSPFLPRGEIESSPEGEFEATEQSIEEYEMEGYDFEDLERDDRESWPEFEYREQTNRDGAWSPLLEADERIDDETLESSRSFAEAEAEEPVRTETVEEPNLGYETEAYLDDIWMSARQLWEKAVVAAAIAKGLRDESKLTNLVFFRRHPERSGRSLTKGEPQFKALATEWTEIREKFVRPALVGFRSGSVTPAASTGPAVTSSGVSAVARQAASQWTGSLRSPPWRIAVYGLVVHQTGGQLPCRAAARGQDPVARAVSYYAQTRGTHYVCGWGGHTAGDLQQVAEDDRYRANGVGMGKQRESVRLGRWPNDLPAAVVAQWRLRWPNQANPMALLPGTKTANEPYVHVEMIPAVVPWCNAGRGLPATTPSPMRQGLRYTAGQHDSIVDLSVDIATRHNWPDVWWETPRLLGHEDLSPITRSDRNGGWDPGGMRAEPWFDWDYVRSAIRRRLGS